MQNTGLAVPGLSRARSIHHDDKKVARKKNFKKKKKNQKKTKVVKPGERFRRFQEILKSCSKKLCILKKKL